jgi:hypothetical protein
MGRIHERYVRDVVQAAARISARLGHTPHASRD